MGRPKKSADEKLEPAMTHLLPRLYDELDRQARARRMSLSELLRERLSAPSVAVSPSAPVSRMQNA